MARKDKHYDDALEEVMSYAAIKLDAMGSRAIVRNPEEMKGILKWLNELEKQKGRAPRFNDEFISRVVDSDIAHDVYTGKTIKAENRDLHYGVPERSIIVKNKMIGRFSGVIKRFIMGKGQYGGRESLQPWMQEQPQPPVEQPTPTERTPTYRLETITRSSGKTVMSARDVKTGRFTKKNA